MKCPQIFKCRLTTVVLITPVATVGRVITPPGVRHALTVATMELRVSTRGRGREGGRRTLVPAFVLPVGTVGLSVTEPGSGHAGLRPAAPKGVPGAVPTGGLVTAVVAVVRPVAEEAAGDASGTVTAGKLVSLTLQHT